MKQPVTNSAPAGAMTSGRIVRLNGTTAVAPPFECPSAVMSLDHTHAQVVGPLSRLNAPAQDFTRIEPKAYPYRRDLRRIPILTMRICTYEVAPAHRGPRYSGTDATRRPIRPSGGPSVLAS